MKNNFGPDVPGIVHPKGSKLVKTPDGGVKVVTPQEQKGKAKPKKAKKK